MNKEYQEGVDFFNKCLDCRNEENPYDFITDQEKRYSWYDGFRDAGKKYCYEKYKIPELQAKIRELVFLHGLKIKYGDEYGTPYAETPEGFIMVIGDDEKERIGGRNV